MQVVFVYLGMRKLILLLFLLPTIAFGQKTYVPDDNLETYISIVDKSGIYEVRVENNVRTSKLVEEFTFETSSETKPAESKWIIYKLYQGDIQIGQVLLERKENRLDITREVFGKTKSLLGYVPYDAFGLLSNGRDKLYSKPTPEGYSLTRIGYMEAIDYYWIIDLPLHYNEKILILHFKHKFA